MKKKKNPRKPLTRRQQQLCQIRHVLKKVFTAGPAAGGQGVGAMKKRKMRIPSEKVQKLCQTKKVLETANEMLVPERWIKGQAFGGMQRDDRTYEKMCAVGATANAIYKLQLPGTEATEANNFLNQCAPNRGRGIVPYNDAAKTTLDDVKAVFKKAIEEVERQAEAIAAIDRGQGV